VATYVYTVIESTKFEGDTLLGVASSSRAGKKIAARHVHGDASYRMNWTFDRASHTFTAQGSYRDIEVYVTRTKVED